MFRHLLTVGLVAAGIATATLAAPPRTGPGMGLGRRPAETPLGKLVSGNLGRMLVLQSELNLTQEQKVQIRDVVLNRRSEIVTTMQAVRAKQTALRDAVLQGKSEDEVRAAADELGDVIADTAVKATKLRNQLAPILTEQQRELIGKTVQDKDQAIDRFLEQASMGR
jgi:Spy/CpxP family protein refolding chaperone